MLGPQVIAKPFGRQRSQALPLGLAASPVLDSKILEAREVLHVRRHKYQVVNVCDGSNLTVHVGSGTTEALLARSLESVPSGLLFAVRQYWKRLQNDVMKECLQFGL